jgi:hypothetical protein
MAVIWAAPKRPYSFLSWNKRWIDLLPEFGIDIAKFHSIGDFGPGFYCADKMRTSLRFAYPYYNDVISIHTKMR